MNLKDLILETLSVAQLKDLCEELDVAADRRSAEAMKEALASAKRAKPEGLIEILDVSQLKSALTRLDQPVGGAKGELIARLLSTGGRKGSVSSEKQELVLEEGRVSDFSGRASELRTRAARTADATGALIPQAPQLQATGSWPSRLP